MKVLLIFSTAFLSCFFATPVNIRAQSTVSVNSEKGEQSVINDADSTFHRKVKELITLGNQFLTKNLPDSNLRYKQLAFDLAAKLNDKELYILANTELGYAHIKVGNYPKAQEVIKKSILLKEQKTNKTEKDFRYLAKLYYNLATVQNNLGDYTLATNTGLAGMKYVNMFNDSVFLSRYDYLLGNIYVTSNQLANGLKCFLDALPLALAKGDTQFASSLCCNIGIAYRESGNDSSAEYYFLKGLELAQKIKSDNDIAIVSNDLGNWYLKKEKFDLAEKYLNLSVKYGEKVNNVATLSSAYYSSGKLLFIRRQFVAAKKRLELGVKFGTLAGDRIELINTYLLLSRADSACNDFGSAYKNYKSYAELFNAITNPDSIMKLNASLTNIVHSLDSAHNNQVLALKDKVNGEKVQRYKNTLYFTIALIVLLALFVAYFSYNIVMRKRLMLALERSKSEIEHKNVLLESDLIEKAKMRKLLENDLSRYREFASRRIMNPHFLFNALNSIQSYFIQNDTLNANMFLSNFALLIRKNMEYSQSEFISIKDEVETIELYLNLEMKRFGDRFSYDINFDSDVERHLDIYGVPPLLLQPVVENSILHGLSSISGAGRISIKFEVVGQQLICLVTDNGIGITKSNENKMRLKSSHKSIAIKANQERLKILSHLTGKSYTMEIREITNKSEVLGTEVRLTLPILDVTKAAYEGTDNR